MTGARIQAPCTARPPGFLAALGMTVSRDLAALRRARDQFKSSIILRGPNGGTDLAPVLLMAGFALVDAIDQVPLMDHDEFRNFEVRLVSLYRSDERAQEDIAVALTTISMSLPDPVTRFRVDEIFDMLQHVHDPWITASSAN